MSRPFETLCDNPAWARATPHVSVLIPFLRDDPTSLLAALDREAGAAGRGGRTGHP